MEALQQQTAVPIFEIRNLDLFYGQVQALSTSIWIFYRTRSLRFIGLLRAVATIVFAHAQPHERPDRRGARHRRDQV